jgi:hypothetical protein
VGSLDRERGECGDVADRHLLEQRIDRDRAREGACFAAQVVQGVEPALLKYAAELGSRVVAPDRMTPVQERVHNDGESAGSSGYENALVAGSVGMGNLRLRGVVVPAVGLGFESVQAVL